MKKIFLLFLFPIIIFGCKKTPTACITSDKDSVLTGESITFTSCSENSQRISWDFGDGTSEEGNSVSHSYSTAGIYLVKMTAFSKKDKKWDKNSTLVIVSEPPSTPTPPAPKSRYLKKIVLTAFPQQNPNGDEWDNDWFDTSGPDIFITMKLSSGEWSLGTTIVTDADSVPLIWSGYGPQNIYLTNENWDIEISDSDDFGTSSELMNSWTVNPATDSSATGMLSLSSSSYSLDIYFDER